MSFSLCNVLTNFQGYMNKILDEKFSIFVIVNLDHIFIYIEVSSQLYINFI